MTETNKQGKEKEKNTLLRALDDLIDTYLVARMDGQSRNYEAVFCQSNL